MPPRGSTTYSRNLYDFRPNIDNLAEEQIDREDRRLAQNLARLERSGVRSAESIRSVSDRMSEGLSSLPDLYRKGKMDNYKLKDEKERQRLLDEMEAAQAEESAPRRGAFVGPPRSAMNAPAREYTNPTLEYLKGNTSTQDYLGMPQRVETTTTTAQQIRPEVRTSPGAAAVLDNRLKAGINPAVTVPGSSVDRPVYGQSTLPLRPQEKPAPAPVAEEQGPLLAGPPTTKPQPRTNRERLFYAALKEAEAKALNAKRGVNPQSRVTPWQNTGKFDENGNPIKFNQITGEYAVDKGIKYSEKAKTTPDDYRNMQLQQRQKEHEDRMALEREKLKKGGAAGGMTPAQAANLKLREQEIARREQERQEKLQREKEMKDAELAVPGYTRTGEVKPSVAEATKMRDSTATLESFNSNIDLYKRMIEENGSAEFFGRDSETMSSLATTLDMELKELYTLGALTGPDYMILKKQIVDPMSSGAIMKDLKTMLSGDPATATAALEDLKRSLNQKVASKLKSTGYAPRGPAQVPQAASPQQRAVQEKTVNGVKYRKVPGGWEAVD